MSADVVSADVVDAGVVDAGVGGAARPRVVVAVLTYRRPGDLAELLPLVVAQAAGAGTPTRVLVVDNDPEAGARDAVLAAAARASHAGGDAGGDAGVDVEHVHEPRPGISAARNRALDAADAAGDDLLVFLDDDERPGERWLRDLLGTWAGTGCAAVVGPVVSGFATPLDPWIEAGGFFQRRRLPTGTPVTVAATNNLLLDLDRLRPTGLRFDERFGISGGSDTLFTRGMTAAGLDMVWCDEAVVTDVVPEHRATRDWVVRRALRSGNGWSRTSLVLARGPGGAWRARAVLTAQGTARVAGGVARLAAGALTRDPGRCARGTKTLARGVGLLSGAYGYTYLEYRRPAGGV